MEFLVGLIDAGIVALIAWWTWRGWYTKPVLSKRLELAGFKAGVGLFLAYLVPGWLANSRPSYDAVVMGVFVFIAAAGVLYVASFVTAVIEGIRDRKAMRLSGHPVPPRLRAAWKVALVTAGVAFVLVLTFLFGVTFFFALAQRSYPLIPGVDGYSGTYPWTIGGGIGFWVAVALAYLIQKFRIWKAEREYEQLSSGIEKRLAEQRQELLTTMNNELAKTKE